MKVKNKRKRFAGSVAVLLIFVSIANTTIFAAAKDYYTDTKESHQQIDFAKMQELKTSYAEVKQGIDDLKEAYQKENNAKEVASLYKQMVQEIDKMQTVSAICDIAYYGDVSQTEEAERSAKIQQDLTDLSDQAYVVISELLDSSYRQVVVDDIGEEAAKGYESYSQMSEREKNLNEQESKLVQEYDSNITAIYSTEVNGEKWVEDTLEQAYFGGEIDYEMYESIYNALEKEKNQAVTGIYLDLLKVRNQIAKENGYDSYPEYAYENIYGRDYETKDIATVCEAVKKYVVPLKAEVDALISEEEMAKIYERVPFTSEETWEKIGEHISDIHPDLQEAYEVITENHLYDIDARDTKMDMGYTTNLNYYGVPFIFNSPYGNFMDLSTIVHEFGHYNQMYHQPEHLLYEASSYDVSEIHSQGLELLFLDYLKDIYGEDSAKTVEIMTISAILSSVIDGCLYDEFQQIAFANEDWEAGELNMLFKELSEEYGYEYENGEKEAYNWVEVSHTFQSPMYYISYATSALSAIDIWAKSLTDREKAVDTYMNVTAAEPQAGYMEVMENCNLRNIFKAGEIWDICKDVETHYNLTGRMKFADTQEKNGRYIVIIAVITGIVGVAGIGFLKKRF